MEQTDIIPEDIPLDIVYEDDDIIIVNKPKGMVVHPAPGHATGTLVNALMYHFGKEGLSSINGEFRPGIVHRIDMNTTGILVVCKNDKAHKSLSEQLKVHSITRKYYAIVCNNISEDEGTVNLPIGRHPKDRKKMAINYKNGRDAVTHYKVLERLGNNKYAFIECQLETGRTHQIRVHMASIHHPILGDDVYGPANCPFKLTGQTLHAGVLGFIHPTTGEYVEFKSELPEYFNKLLVCDYRELFNAHKANKKALFLLDPPYLQTEHSAYKADTYWQLKDCLDVLTLLDDTKYVLFTSGKSQIIELCDWINQSFGGKLLKGTQKYVQNSRINNFAAYKDIMIAKL